MMRKSPGKRKYSRASQKKVEKVMHEWKRGKLKMGRSGKKVKSRKQAIAIGLSEARKEGKKVPSPKK
jgi:ribosomal protein L32E